MNGRSMLIGASVACCRTPACGDSCHVAVKAKDYVFHPYQNR